MNILNILENLVCRDHLFSFLEVNDLLRLRRVSQTFKNEAQDFIRTKKVSTKREIEIDFKWKLPFEDLDTFQQSLNDLPIRKHAHLKFYSKNEEIRPFHKPLQSFLNNFANNITHLTLRRLQISFHEVSMVKVLDSFSNVAHLVLEEVDIDRIPSIPVAYLEYFKIPSSWSKLKTLKIERVCFGLNGHFIKSFFHKLVEICLPNLEELKLFDDVVQNLEDQDKSLEEIKSLAFYCLFNAPKLKLVNVPWNFIEKLLEPDYRTPEMGSVDAVINNINRKVISIRDPKISSFVHELPNLEGIEVHDIDECRIPERDIGNRYWPNLKEIKLTLKDNMEDSFIGDYSGPSLANLFDCLFGGGSDNLTRLEIEFLGFVSHKEEYTERMHQFLPRTLITGCSNLKILHVVQYITQLVNLQQLWVGLPLLEELSFDHCHEINDSDFVGEDPNYPVFWKLKHLKVLKLLGVDGTQVTDHLCSKVLCHMPLKELTLSSCNNETNRIRISFKGIKSLLTGQFARTIERLDISQLNLCPLSMKKKEELESLFRSSQMI